MRRKKEGKKKRFLDLIVHGFYHMYLDLGSSLFPPPPHSFSLKRKFIIHRSSYKIYLSFPFSPPVFLFFFFPFLFFPNQQIAPLPLSAHKDWDIMISWYHPHLPISFSASCLRLAAARAKWPVMKINIECKQNYSTCNFYSVITL